MKGDLSQSLRHSEELTHKMNGLRTKEVPFSFKLLSQIHQWQNKSTYYLNQVEDFNFSIFSSLSDAELQEQGGKLNEVFARFSETEEDKQAALGILNEFLFRNKGYHLHKVQLAGILALQDSYIIEMATGEGKTVTCACAAILKAWRGSACHVLTVNDYLVQRDQEEFKSFYQFFGLKSSYVLPDMNPQQKTIAYSADIIYLDHKTVLGDFLKDRVSFKNYQRSLIKNERGHEQPLFLRRGLNYCIIDEVDSILIDEADTPLILSQEKASPEIEQMLKKVAIYAEELDERSYKVDHIEKNIELRPTTVGKLDDLDLNSYPTMNILRAKKELLIKALRVKYFFKCDSDYIIENDKVVIIDRHSGRMMPDRSWRMFIHQFVEIREGVDISPQKQVMARMDFQFFFKIYHSFCGLTGTAGEAWKEFSSVYEKRIIRIPENLECQRSFLGFQLLKTVDLQEQLLVERLKNLVQEGRPVLIAVRTVEQSLRISELLKDEELEHDLLNAQEHQREAEVISKAGERGRLTICTNMAGRGTDIKLTELVAEQGGLHVIIAFGNESMRTDRQIAGRSARQGDPGSYEYILSLEDPLFDNLPIHLEKMLTLSQSLGAQYRIYKQVASFYEKKALMRRQNLAKQRSSWINQLLGMDPS